MKRRTLTIDFHLATRISCAPHQSLTVFDSSEEMKSCPTCHRIYADETLTYCLEDGATLSAPYESEQTQRLPPPRATTPATEVLPTGSAATQPVQRGRNPVPVYVAIGLAALLAGGVLVAWMKSGPTASTTARSEVSNSAPSPGEGRDSLEEEKARLERERQQLALEKERQQLAEERRKLEEQKREAATPTSTPQTARQIPQPSGGGWFVFLGAFSRGEYARADERLRQIKGLGYDASIIDTDDYPNLTRGLWAVVMGPYSRSNAQSVAAQMKAVRPDAYIKSGW